MAHINLSRAHSVFAYDGFEGIDGSKIRSGKGGIKRMTDFRINFDGSIEKRYGFTPLRTLPGKPRALHRVRDNEFLALIGNELYSFDLFSGDCTLLDTLYYPSEGEASFIEHGGSLYLIDGTEIYVMIGNKLIMADGYVPLYGQHWSCESGGSVNEPINLLSNHIRISFDIRGGYNSVIRLPFEIASVDYAFVNGVLDTETEYRVYDNKALIYPIDLPTYTQDLTLFLTLPEGFIDRSKIASCRYAASFGNRADQSTSIFYGGNERSALFPTRTVDDASFKEANDLYIATFNIYVPDEDRIILSDTGSCVNAVCPKDNGLMLFTERSTYMLTPSQKGEHGLTKLSSCFGSSSKNGVILFEDRPISVSFTGIMKWTPLSNESNAYDVECISGGIQSDLSDSFARSAFPFHYQSKNEIWFCDPSDESGTVRIYSADAGAWFYFTGIHAERLLEVNGEVCFLRDDTFYIFSPVVDGIPSPSAIIESGLIMLPPQNESKKLLLCLIRTSPGAKIDLTVVDAKNRSTTYSLADTSGEQIGYIEKRLYLHRSRYYSFSLTAKGPSVIYGISFVAQK